VGFGFVMRRQPSVAVHPVLPKANLRFDSRIHGLGLKAADFARVFAMSKMLGMKAEEWEAELERKHAAT
jgi:hypothetical protein